MFLVPSNNRSLRLATMTQFDTASSACQVANATQFVEDVDVNQKITDTLLILDRLQERLSAELAITLQNDEQRKGDDDERDESQGNDSG